MSDYSVIAALGDSLVSVLFYELNADTQISGLIDSDERISLESPAGLENNNSVRLSMYLYRIVENPYLKNQFSVEGTGGKQRKPPLALDLYYLLTPMLGTPREQQIVLGKAMQILYDRAILLGADLGDEPAVNGEEVRLVLNPVSLEELTRVWQALEIAYRLSVCYIARVVILDSEQQQFRQQVVSKSATYGVVQAKV
jgi:hypothetical protein